MKPFSHWRFVIRERQADWHRRLSATDADFYASIK